MFPIKESFKHGWDKTKTNFWKILSLLIIAIIPSFASSAISAAIENSHSVLAIIILVILIVAVNIASVVIDIGFIKMSLRISDGENPPVKDIFSAYGVFWRYLGASILYGLIILGGFILLIIPGIIWTIKYSFAPLIVIDTKAGPIAALKESGRITDGSKWKLFGFGLLSALVAAAGYLAFFVGALVTIPITTFAWVYVYRTLSKAKAGVSAEPLSSPQVLI